MTEENGRALPKAIVYCSVVEWEGEEGFGVRGFVQMPCRGDVIELYLHDADFMAKVEGIQHVEVDEDGEGETILYVKVIK